MTTAHVEQVDLIALAMQTAKNDVAHAWPNAVKVIAPAKVNLLLGIHAPRADGYHPVHNIMHALTLHDVLYMQPAEEFSLEMLPTGGFPVPDVAAEDNLATKAIAALAQACGVSHPQMAVRIEKNIPAQAGLGGGSADAAAALVGAAHLWGITPDDPRIAETARTLGADVAFFLQGGCALFTGVGERFEKAYTPRKDALVLVQPQTGLSTAAVYRAFDEQASPMPETLLEQALHAQNAADVPLFNGLTIPATNLLDELADIQAWLQSQPGVAQVALTGSGSVMFAICESFADASHVAAQAKLQGWWARSSTFSSARASVV